MSTRTLMVIATLLVLGPTARGELLLTGVMDGTLTGGEPKVAELYATADIADLSVYAIGRYGNGSATISDVTPLPTVAATAGTYLYAVGNTFVDQTAVFDSVFPDVPDGDRFQNDGVNSNGDDVTALVLAADESLIDVFGEIGVDGSGTAWDHLDGWAYRLDGTGPSAVFDVGEWALSGINALDGLDAAGIGAAVPFGTYVPEPASAAVLVLAGALIGARPRKSG